MPAAPLGRINAVNWAVTARKPQDDLRRFDRKYGGAFGEKILIIFSESLILNDVREMAPTLQHQRVPNFILSILTYAPVPLFAESLRVQTTLALTILSNSSFDTSLTGCIRDLHRLWDMDEKTIFGETGNDQIRNVVSLRHGSEFRLANPTIFETFKITTKKRLSNFGENAIRQTTVGVTFVMPHKSQALPYYETDFTLWISRLASVIEIVVFSVFSVYLASSQMIVGSILMSCLLMTVLLLLTLRVKTNPIFAHAHARNSDVERSVKGGAALDVHVIATHWNSSRLDVLCGFSSQLGSLTNIPVRVTGRTCLRLVCPILALVLLLQAAALASMFGKNDEELTLDVWSPAIWISAYLLMLVPNSLVQKRFPESQQRNLPGFFIQAPLLGFSSRRAALGFISTLPVSERTNKWAWTDTFMPDNSRRREWQNELDKFPTPESMEAYLRDPDVPPGSQSLRKVMKEIADTYHLPVFKSNLSQYIMLSIPRMVVVFDNRRRC